MGMALEGGEGGELNTGDWGVGEANRLRQGRIQTFHIYVLAHRNL